MDELPKNGEPNSEVHIISVSSPDPLEPISSIATKGAHEDYSVLATTVTKYQIPLEVGGEIRIGRMMFLK